MCLRVFKTLLEFWQAQCFYQFPGEPVPVPKHRLGEKPFPDIQSEPPPSQHQAIPSGPKLEIFLN